MIFMTGLSDFVTEGDHGFPDFPERIVENGPKFPNPLLLIVNPIKYVKLM